MNINVYEATKITLRKSFRSWIVRVKAVLQTKNLLFMICVLHFCTDILWTFLAVIIVGALCIFGDIIKHAGKNKDLRPKPHLYLSIMRAFATRGDVDMVMRLNKRMWPDSAGSISRAAKEEAHELLMEAAINNNQVEMKPRMKLAVWQYDLDSLHMQHLGSLGFSFTKFY